MLPKGNEIKEGEKWLLLFFSFSFIGWFWEVLFYFVREGGFANRGVLYGPWLPIYGSVGVLIVCAAKYLKRHPVFLFLTVAGLSAVTEYLTSLALERLTGKRWWDYSSYPWNLDGRVCLYGLVFFGAGGVALVYWVVPWLEKLFSHFRISTLRLTVAALTIIFAVDVVLALRIPNQGEGISNPAVMIENKKGAPQ